MYRSLVAHAIPAGLPADAAEAARATLGGALVVAGRLPEQLRLELLDAARAAFVHAFRLVAVVSAAIAVLMAPVAGILLRGPAREGGQQPGATA
jgi:MFS transporter, DHA2 family, multidrug resistance protein